ncbi:MAG: EAL domain-containing protein [Betaproteobacteria bacterium]|nr:EAL domain-containing protein [Betaproteobacteria bacterium]
MPLPLGIANRLPIRVRVAIALVAATGLAVAAMLAGAAHSHRAEEIEQARAFAESVNQLVLAGLTGFMIAGVPDRRGVFLDQIEQANDVRGLRVLRGEAVDRQYGASPLSTRPTDPAELQVIATGKAFHEVRRDGEHEYLKAVMPTLALRDSLGKNCLGCHLVPEGTVLGAVTLEISLDRMNAATASFLRQMALIALAILVPLALLVHFTVRRTVSRPLEALAGSLDDIASGQVDLRRRLSVDGDDEIARARAAFNRVLGKADAMTRSERIAADVFENAIEGIVVTDVEARIVRVNPSFTTTTGYSAEEAIGQRPSLLKSGRHDESFYREFWSALMTKGEWQGEIWNRRKNGEVYPERLNISSVRGADGRIQNYVAIFADITEHKRQEALITHQARHDSLTGLPNRLVFKDRLERAIVAARRATGQLAVLFLDLDRFKQINDSLGHDAGDELLRQVAQRLRGAVRESDTVSRLGGDEFTLLLPQVDGAAGAGRVAETVLEAVRRPYRLGERDLRVTTSVGVALGPDHGDDAETLMKHADTAMYHAKEQGRAGYRIYDAELGARLDRRLRFSEELQRALEEGELRAYYQPQISLDTGAMTGVEAVLRWQHPGKGLLGPSDFAGLADETGLLLPVGEWLLREACSQVARWLAEGRDLVLTVNVLPRQFHHEGLAASVARVLAETGLAPARLELDIDESLAMRDVERTIAILRSLAALGVRLAIAEFGQGLHASVGDLRRMPIDAVKVARAVVRDVADDPDGFRSVSILAALGRQDRLEVVAVGVETSEQLEILRRMRCDNAKGRYLGEALPASSISALAAT